MTIVLFFKSTDPGALADTNPHGANVTVRLWRPGSPEAGPELFMGLSHHVYLAFHRLGVFRNRDYSALCLDRQGAGTVHVSSIFPPFFRFPFMDRIDLQIGATYTRPEARGQGLASLALGEAAKRLARPGRAIWYLTEASNLASVQVAKNAGFTLVGEGQRKPRFGISALSAYQMSVPAKSASADWTRG